MFKNPTTNGKIKMKLALFENYRNFTINPTKDKKKLDYMVSNFIAIKNKPHLSDYMAE